MLHGGRYDFENENRSRDKIEYDLSVNTVKTPDFIKEALKSMAEDDKTYDYPDRMQTAFRKKVAESVNCKPDQVAGGNGASEIFAGIVRMISPKKALLIAPSFYGYEHALKGEKDCEIRFFTAKEENDFDITEEYPDALDESLDMVFIANPNNPTGRALDGDLMIKILNKCRDLKIYIVVDECFIGFWGREKSLIKYVNEYRNLFVVDAYTKLFGLAGLRVGFCISCSDNIDRIRKVLPEWNMSSLAQSLGEICAEKVKQREYEKGIIEKIRENKAKVIKLFDELNIKYIKGEANFILFRYEGNENLQEKLLKNGILIRDCSNFKGFSTADGYYRVSLSDEEGLLRFMKCIKTQFNGDKNED
ncbi:MAG: aminotransferase class I/II-fold pyridoxal phosphate-dependent enzyme [Acetatifactor sp.]|nr:aminotransferase class I/II-fold pyridoxal phosphate-dependent enzyme [Acetatifactor sp.]